MKNFSSYITRHKIFIAVFVGVCFVFSFLHLQNFDPTHPTLVNNTCIQGLAQCVSAREMIDAFLAALVALAQFSIVIMTGVVVGFVLRLYISDVMYIPILVEPIRLALRKGILHSKAH